MYRKIIVASLSVLMAGCAIVTYDRSNAPGMDMLVGKSFIVAQDSFLIENSCVKEYFAKQCFLLQVTGGYIQYVKSHVLGGVTTPVQLPESFAAFNADPSSFNGKYASRTSLFTDSKLQNIAGTVPKGTVITITRLVSKANGEDGRCWLVYGRLTTVDKNIAIEIPACGMVEVGPGERHPYWFTLQCPKPKGRYHPGPDNYTLPPVPRPSFLIPLSKNAITAQPCSALHSLQE